MRALTVTLYLVSFAAELTAVILLLLDARDASAALKRWVGANPGGNDEGAYGQLLELNDIMLGLLGSPRTRYTAVGLILFGLVAGMVGNLTSLHL